MPLIFLHQCNNSAISARIDYGEHYGDEGEYGVKRIQKRSAEQLRENPRNLHGLDPHPNSVRSRVPGAL